MSEKTVIQTGDKPEIHFKSDKTVSQTGDKSERQVRRTEDSQSDWRHARSTGDKSEKTVSQTGDKSERQVRSTGDKSDRRQPVRLETNQKYRRQVREDSQSDWRQAKNTFQRTKENNGNDYWLLIIGQTHWTTTLA